MPLPPLENDIVQREHWERLIADPECDRDTIYGCLKTANSCAENPTPHAGIYFDGGNERVFIHRSNMAAWALEWLAENPAPCIPGSDFPAPITKEMMQEVYDEPRRGDALGAVAAFHRVLAGKDKAQLNQLHAQIYYNSVDGDWAWQEARHSGGFGEAPQVTKWRLRGGICLKMIRDGIAKLDREMGWYAPMRDMSKERMEAEFPSTTYQALEVDRNLIRQALDRIEARQMPVRLVRIGIDEIQEGCDFPLSLIKDSKLEGHEQAMGELDRYARRGRGWLEGAALAWAEEHVGSMAFDLFYMKHGWERHFLGTVFPWTGDDGLSEA